jgi:hypothetical protein
MALLAGCALSSLGAAANGAIVFSDNFDSYTNGTLSGQGGWTATAVALTPMQVAGGTDKYVQLNTSGQDEYHALSASVPHTDGNFIETSMTINVSAAQANGDYFNHLSDPVGTSTLFYQRLFAKSTTGGYLLGIVATSGGTPVTTYGTGVLAFNTEHTVDVIWNFVAGALNDTFSVSVDSLPYVNYTWDSTSAEPAQISAVNLRQGAAANSATLQLDDLQVQGTVPEPASLALVGLVGLGLLRRRS